MQQQTSKVTVETNRPGLYELTKDIVTFVEASPIETGLLTLFCQHTSASLLIQENADPTVQQDLQNFFSRLVPEDRKMYLHKSEGLDDMPAHIKSALTQTSLSVPIGKGKPLLGTWQGIYLFEHRNRPHQRTVLIHLLGDESSEEDYVPLQLTL